MRNYKHGAWAIALGITLTISSTIALPDADARTYRAGTTYTRMMKAADQDLQTGRYQAAETKYMNLLKRNPGNVPARASLATAQAELFKLGAAEKNADMVLSRDPDNAMARIAKGIVYRNRTASMDMTYRNRRDELLAQSAAELRRAVESDPNSAEAHTQLGITYRFMGRYGDAKLSFARALERDPHFAEALLNEGIVLMAEGDVHGAKNEFQRAVQLNSKNHMAHYRLGEAYLAMGDIHQALNSLNTALALNPGNASVMTRMGDAYEAQGNTAAAIAQYRKAINASPAYMPAYMAISDIFDNRGDGELAMAELRSALNVNPNFSEGRNRLGRIALTVDKPDQALQYFKESLRINPQDPEAIQGLSQALTVVAQKQANWSQTMGADSDLVTAEQSIQEALRLNPNDLRLHLANLRISRLAGKPAYTQAQLQQLVSVPPRNESEEMLQGEAYLAMGQYQAADIVFGRMMQRAAGNPDKLLVIGDTLKVNGDLPRAQDAYRMALRAEPGNLKAQRGIDRIESAQAESDKNLRLAKALNNWRQKDSSVDFYEEALAKNPRQPEARLALSKLYEKLDQYEQAALSYRFYLGLQPNLPEKKRQKYLKKIAKMEEKAAEQAMKAGAQTSTTPVMMVIPPPMPTDASFQTSQSLR